MNPQRCAGKAFRVTRDDDGRARMAAHLMQHRIPKIREGQFLLRLQDGPIDWCDLEKRGGTPFTSARVRRAPRGLLAKS